MRRVVRGASCPWGEMSVGRNVHGAKCPWGEMSVGRVVRGARCHGASCPGASCPGASCLGASGPGTVTVPCIITFRHLTIDCLFQENKSYGSKNHLHSSSDVLHSRVGHTNKRTGPYEGIVARDFRLLFFHHPKYPPGPLIHI
jgi:hypothetical protein